MKRQKSIVDTSEVRLPWLASFMEALDSPRSLTVAILWRNREFGQLARLRALPRDYLSASQYRAAAQATDLLRKWEDLPCDVDRKAAAGETFLKAEAQCRETNDRLSDLLYNGPTAKDEKNFFLLEKARSFISRILGRAPALTALQGRFGPGTTNQTKGKFVKAQKYSAAGDATQPLTDLMNSMHGPFQNGWVLGSFLPRNVVDHEEICFVPKTALTDRTIGIPVHLNSYFQLAVGGELRSRLDRYRRLRLSHTQEHHGWLASVAQTYGLSTVDLSSASDTVSYMIVKWLLPDDWFHILSLGRVEYFRMAGEIRPYEKYSAMGNGYTFELETLIFYALALACGGSFALTSTYGDDIVIEREFHDELEELLGFAGFSVNAEKSFRDGSFFESCGQDFFDGIAVRPFFLKSLRSPGDSITLVNAISKAAQWPSQTVEAVRDIRFRRSFTIARSLCRENARLIAPTLAGDIGIHVNQDEALTRLSSCRMKHGWQGWRIYTLQFIPTQKNVADSCEGLRHRLDTPGHFGDFRLYESESLGEQSFRKQGAWRVRPTIWFNHWSGPGPWG